MESVSFNELKESAQSIPLQQEQSYLISYKEFIAYFKNIETINLHNFIIGSHFVYGWMPTILNIQSMFLKLLTM